MDPFFVAEDGKLTDTASGSLTWSVSSAAKGNGTAIKSNFYLSAESSPIDHFTITIDNGGE